jgi:hypothetical protein
LFCTKTLGVYDAVKRGYLKSLLFGISTNAEGTELLEVKVIWIKMFALDVTLV